MFHSYPPLLFWFLLLRFPVSIQTLLQLHFYCILPETAFSSFFPALFSSAFSGRNPWSYASGFFYLTDDPVHIDRSSRPPLHLVRRQLPLPGNNSLHTLHFLCPHLLYSSNIFRFPAFSIYACPPFFSCSMFLIRHTSIFFELSLFSFLLYLLPLPRFWIFDNKKRHQKSIPGFWCRSIFLRSIVSNDCSRYFARTKLLLHRVLCINDNSIIG